jgi:hypothetical protein
MGSSVLSIVAIVIYMASPIRPGSKAPNTPTFLEPIRTTAGVVDHYVMLVSTALLGNQTPKLGMIVRPSFRLEYAVTLRKISQSDSLSAERHIVEYSVVSKQLWSLMDNYSGRDEKDIIKEAGVRRVQAIVPDSVSASVFRAWDAMLNYSYPSHADSMVRADGEDYEFFLGSGKRAMTWSPRSGACKMLVDLGEMLIKYTSADDYDRPNILRKVVNLSGRVEKAAASGMEIK